MNLTISTLIFVLAISTVTASENRLTQKDFTVLLKTKPRGESVTMPAQCAPIAAGGQTVSNMLSVLAQTKETKRTWTETQTHDTRQIPGASSLYKRCAPGVTLIATLDGESFGAGSVVSTEGEIVTNWHVVQGNDKVIVFFYDAEVSSIEDLDPEACAIADVVSIDTGRDIALLKLTAPRQISKLSFGSDRSLAIAQDAFAIGHPENLIWSFTYGVISQLRKGFEWYYDDQVTFKADVIQTQTPTNPGNSGGPLFNDEGEFIGINSFSAAESQGLNFAIRIGEIKQFLAEARAGQHAPAAITSRQVAAEPEIEWWEFDLDEDGTVDSYGTDLDGDGTYDMFQIDEDQNGVMDYFIIDSNKDGEIDMYIYDKDGDEFFEYWSIDSDFDGDFETEGIDDNLDGEPDRLR